MTLARGTRLGPYEIVSAIGAGGMGEVYRAHDPRLRRDVAVKVLPSTVTADAERLRRFEQEALAAARLNHPNILVVYDIGTDGGIPYVVSELLEGETLDRRLAHTPFEIGEVMELASQLADGLAAAHDQGITHRDIKPSNVFITTRRQIKILDFGLAKVSDPVPMADVSRLETVAARDLLTSPGTTVGTVAYMSPEQARGEQVDARSDLFSVGVVLYEMTTSTRPFSGGTSAVIFDAILNRAATPASGVRPGVPEGLDRVIGRCLEKDPLRRYQSAADLLDDLRALRRAADLTGAGRAGAAKSVPSIAVLPFADLSPQRDQDYFCDGMAEELINALSVLTGVHVAARTSSFQFKGKAIDVSEIGQRLKVETVLEGSVRKAGNRLRITVQLTDASNGYQVWSERYDRDLDDVFAVQDEIARAIVEKLKVKLAGADQPLVRRHTENLQAYNLYLEGRHFWLHRYAGFLERGLEHFDQAVALDPTYALAQTGVAEGCIAVGAYGLAEPRAVADKGRHAARRAVALDPGLAESHHAMGLVHWFFDWDHAAAERAFRRALVLSPNAGLTHAFFGLALGQRQRFDEAIAEGARASALEPVSALIQFYYGCTFWYARRYAEALDQFEKVVGLDPGFPHVYWGQAAVLGSVGRHGEAVEAAERSVTLTNRQTFFLAVLGWSLAPAGRRDEAKAILDELHARAATQYVSAVHFADIAVSLGDRDGALGWLERAVEERVPLLVNLATLQAYDPLREDPRFASILQKVGLTPTRS